MCHDHNHERTAHPFAVSHTTPNADAKIVGPFTLNHRYAFTMPAGTISDYGREQINTMIQRATPKNESEWLALNPGNSIYYTKPLPDDWDWVWISHNKKSPYGTGKLTTRVEKHFKKTMELKCPVEFITAIGNVARANSSEPMTYNFDFVDSIDWDAGDFGDPNSCWWGEYSSARKALTDSGGLAIRFFDSNGDGKGRAWLAPHQGHWILFNGYGFNNATITIAQLVAAFLNVSYKYIPIENWNSKLYLNSDRGILIGPYDLILPIDKANIKMGPREIRCCACGSRQNEASIVVGPNDREYCPSCYRSSFASCDDCQKIVGTRALTAIHGNNFCEECRDRHGVACPDCRMYHPMGSLISVDGGKEVCKRCVERNYTKCTACHQWKRDIEVRRVALYEGDSSPYSRSYGHHCRDCYQPPRQQLRLRLFQ